MKGRQIIYTTRELDWIRANSALPRRELHAGFVAHFDRPEVTLDQIKGLCKRRGWHTGRTGQFAKGTIPPNKGRKGYHPPGCEKGWFKKGTRNGRARQNYKPIGTERISKEGYVERKVNDDMPFQRRWRGVHLINWEAANGPIPEGHRLKSLDGDKSNTDPGNWIAVPYAMGPRLAGRHGINYDTAPPELRPALLATARLEHAMREAKANG